MVGPLLICEAADARLDVELPHGPVVGGNPYDSIAHDVGHEQALAAAIMGAASVDAPLPLQDSRHQARVMTSRRCPLGSLK